LAETYAAFPHSSSGLTRLQAIVTCVATKAAKSASGGWIH